MWGQPPSAVRSSEARRFTVNLQTDVPPRFGILLRPLNGLPIAHSTSESRPPRIMNVLGVSHPKKEHGSFLPHPFRFVQCLFLALGSLAAAQTPPAPAPTQDYLVYVVCESADRIVLIRFGPGGAHIESQVRTGLMPMDVNGPHGIAVSPDKQF